MSAAKIHYAGSIDHARGYGWAACCSGDRAVAIRESGANTHDHTLVTCKRCQQMIQQNNDYVRAHPNMGALIPRRGI